ncbi:MAG: aminopeptidase [Eubacterium sp.]|nr:aminopeptidase [Eubacterium sp.]
MCDFDQDICNDDIQERYSLACERLNEWVTAGEADRIPEVFREYMTRQAMLLVQVVAILRNPKTMANASANARLYDDIAGNAYEMSFTNPTVCMDSFSDYGKKTALALNWIATHVRDTIVPAYEGDVWPVLIWLEFFLELAGTFSTMELHDGCIIDDDKKCLAGSLGEMIYFFIHDYDEIRIRRKIREMVVPDEESVVFKLVMDRNHNDPSYLYEYGDYISDNEIGISRFLSGMSDSELEEMASTYTNGFKKGFEIAGIDLSEKKTVEIRYNIGFEPMVKKAVEQFEQMGLKSVFRRRTNTSGIGVISSPPNRQYIHDHRFDDALYLNSALTAERMKHLKSAFDSYRDEAGVYAGSAVIETFGEELFIPEKKESAPRYSDEQEKISVRYKRDYALLQDEYIPGDKRSFTIIAYPVPEIGDKFNDIFSETVTLNTLDQELYRNIHQAIIDALDEGEYVRVRGNGENKTDIKVMLHKLDDPAHQTNFENCLADVNIPVGEVFTSPVLTGTEGTLHVSYVYLNGLRYENLEFKFHDGMVTSYSCSNYKDADAQKAYIRENILNNHDTLPIGEFAIGTNTSAYVMGRKYGIEAKLPILIAEKTGPHFALGDTCYSMSEDVIVKNPDGKEVIARDNECSIKRKDDPSQAYFQCHTDITIPYDELGCISVFTKEGKEIIIIKDGRFVLQGTEGLNRPLELMS